MTDPDQDILDFYNQNQGASPSATMTPDPDQDILDFYNKSRNPTPTATAAPSRSPYTDQAVQQASSTFNPPEKPGIVSTVAGSAARGFLPGRAMLAAYPYGSVLGAAGVGAVRGALVGAAVPIAGETGISEAIGGVIGGLIAGGIAAWGVHKLQTKAADVISPGGAFSSKTEQAQVAAHPYAAIVGGGLSFGKPNPMNVYRAGRTLASKEGRAAMVAFTKTRGQGMNPQSVDEVGNVINVAMAGGLNSAFNVKDQIESGHFDPGQLAVAAATGFIFNEPWFHKPNPAAAAAAKTMAQFGVPSVVPSEPTAPPGIAAPGPPAAPGVVPPPTPRIPGLLDFETMPRPASETARAPEAPLPEAPIPRPGTEVTTIPEGGEINAPQTREVTEGRVEQHPGISSRENLPAHPPEVWTEQGERPGDRRGTEPAPEEPVAFEDKLSQFRQRLLESDIAPPQWKALRDSIMNEGKGGEFMGLTEDQRMAVLEAMNDVNLAKIQGKSPYVIEREGDRFEIKDVRNRDRVVSLPQDTLEKAQQRKATLDKQFLKRAAKGSEAEVLAWQNLQREHEQETLAAVEEHQARGGDELVDVLKSHGLPLIPEATHYTGELTPIREMFASIGSKTGRKGFGNLVTGTGEKLGYKEVFREGGGSLDSLAQTLKQKGFEINGKPVETISDAIKLIQDRLSTGKKAYGSEARAQALEEQSYQGPMYMKNPFGKFFKGKEPEPPPNPVDYPGYEQVKPIENPQVLHQTLEVDKDKGAQVVASTIDENGVGEKTIEMGMNRKQVARRLNKDAYEGSIVNTSVKELVQNSFDAVRAAIEAAGKKSGKILVDVDPNARTIDVSDVGEGSGMTSDVVEKGFFTIGGSVKETSPENTSGGIGVAKIAIMYGAKRVRLETVRDGLKTVVDATGEQIEDGFFKLVTTRSNEPNGTKVHVEIPETYLDANGETRYIYFDRSPDFLKQPLFGPVEVIYNGTALPNGIHTTGWQKDNTFNFGWGHVDVHVDPRPTESPEYKVLSAGLYQFDVSQYAIFGSGENAIKHNMVFDVRSRVRADHPDYPFNNQREGFQAKRKGDVADMWYYLKRQGVEQQLLSAKEDFQKVQVLPDIDIEKNLTPADQAEIEKAFKKPTRPEVTGKGEQAKSVTFTPDDVVTTDKEGKQTTQTRATYGIGERTFQAEREVNLEKTKLDVSNFDPNKPLFHNNTNADYSDIHGSHELFTQLGNTLVKFMRHFGKQLTNVENYGELERTDPGGWFGGIGFDTTYGGLNMVNPFKSIWFNPGDLSVAGVHSPDAAASETMHTFLHEITHTPQRNEGAGFTWEMKVNYGRIRAYKVEYQKYEKILERIYEKYFDAAKAIRERHKSYDTRNRADSFKSGSKVGPEQGEGQAAGKGAPGEHAPEDVGLPEPGRTGSGRAGEANPDAGPIGEILAGQKSGAVSGAEPAPAQVAAPAPQPEAVPATAPVPEGVSGIRDTLAGIREAAAQPPETPEQRRFAPAPVETGEHEVRPPTPSEQASPRREMSGQEMSRTIENSLQRFHEEALTTSGTSSGGLSHNDIIDAGRDAIRRGVDPEAVAGSRAIPVDQKYTVTQAHGEDLREMAESAEDLARRNPSQVNKDAADAAFADYSNWDKETVRPLRKQVEEQYPGVPPEEYNPRSMTDLRQQMIRQNNRDFSTRERIKAEAQLKEVERATKARNKELMKWDEELRKGSPELVKDIKNGDDLFEYVANVMKKLFPCT